MNSDCHGDFDMPQQKRRSLLRGVLVLLGTTAALVFVISLPASLEITSSLLVALTHNF
jgi:hypothetical protein